MPGSDPVQSIVRAFSIMEAVSRGHFGMRSSDLAGMLNLNPKTAFSLLKTMVQYGYLQKDSQRRYHLGPTLWELIRNDHANAVLQLAEDAVRNLAAAFPGSVVTFAELIGTESRSRLRISPDRPGILQYPVYLTHPLYTSATGLCFLSQDRFAPMLYSAWDFDEYGVQRWKDLKNLKRFLDSVPQENGVIRLELPPSSNVALAVSAGENFSLSIKVSASKSDDAAKQLLEAVKVIHATTKEVYP